MVVRKLKEKCKESARMRREKERAEFHELAKLLPLPSSITSQLDKASIIRLTSSYLRMRTAFPQGLGVNWGNASVLRGQKSMGHSSKVCGQEKADSKIRELGSLILQTLDGFVFALHHDGKIMYISETASVHLGLPQIDLTGSSIYEYVHQSDHEDLNKVLSLSDNEQQALADNECQRADLGRSFCIRMRCVLPKRNAGLVSGGFKAIHCGGYLKVARTGSGLDCDASTRMEGLRATTTTTTTTTDVVSEEGKQHWNSCALVAVGHPLLPAASTEVKLTENSFMFRSSLDLKFHYIEESVNDILGYTQREMIGISLYQFVHVEDLFHLEDSHRLLIEKGQAVTRYYRLMKRNGGFVWVQTHALLINGPRNLPKPQHIVSVCFVLGDNNLEKSMISSDVIIDDGDQECNQPTAKQQATGESANNQPRLAQDQMVVENPRKKPAIISLSNCKLHKAVKHDRCAAVRKTQRLKTGNAISIHQQSIVHPSAFDSALNATSQVHYPSAIVSHDYGQQQQQFTWQTDSLSPNQISIRRPSDDSCSVVSSIASTSVSSVASSSGHSVESSFLAGRFADSYPVMQHDQTNIGNFLPSEQVNLNEQLRVPVNHQSIPGYDNCQESRFCLQHQNTASPISVKISEQEPIWLATPAAKQQLYLLEDEQSLLRYHNVDMIHFQSDHQPSFDSTNVQQDLVAEYCRSTTERQETNFIYNEQVSPTSNSNNNDITNPIYHEVNMQSNIHHYVNAFTDTNGHYVERNNVNNFCNNANSMYRV